jgi:hypothetical protein
MFTRFEQLAEWSEKHGRSLAIVAAVALPGTFLIALILNALVPTAPINFALLVYASAPFGIWSLGCLLSRVWFGSTRYSDDPTPLQKVMKGFGVLILTLWMLSPLGIFAVLVL